MTSNNKTTSTPRKALVPAPNLEKVSQTKHSNPLDVRPTVLKHSDQDPTTILGAVPSNTPILDATNTAVEPTEDFNTIVSNTIESLPFISDTISYEPKTLLLQKIITNTADSVRQIH